MPYVQTFDRTQMMMCSWDSFVDPESIARLIDAFVDSLDLKKYHVKEVAKEGRPSYDPRGMYKLYIYGSRKGIRSSRKLAESCKVNLEVKWMMGGVEPDFRTISEFRKVNIDRLKEIFVQRQECQDINDEIKTKLSSDLVRLAVIENQLKVITWLLYAVAGGVITMLIKLLFGG